MFRISRTVKNILFVLPMLICLLIIGNEQATSANIVKKAKIHSLENQELNLSVNLTQGKADSSDKSDSTKNIKFGFAFNNSFGVNIDGCYYQVEQIIDGVTGHLYCGTLIVFCQDSVEIYTGGSHCS